MSEFEIVKPEDLLESIPNAPLGSQSIVVDLVKGNIDQSTSLGIDGLAFNLQAGASLTVHGFNSEDDKDDDGVFGKKGSGGDETELQPVLFPGTSAYLKYRGEAEVKASAQYAGSFLAIDASGKKTVVLAQYRKHAPTENARDAFLADVKGLKSVRVKSTVGELTVGDAVALRLSGELRASLELDWTDVFTAGMGTLTRVLRSQTAIGAKISVGVNLKANVSVQDDFVIVFKAEGGGKTRVAIRKAKTRAAGIQGGFGIEASFSDPKGVEAALTAFVNGVVGATVTKIDGILEKTTLEDLTDTERKILDALVERFSELGDVVDDLAKLRVKWDALKDKLNKTITAIAKAKLEAGFRYEYQRTATSLALLEVIADTPTVVAWHESLIHAELKPAMDAIASHSPNVELVRFLKQQTWSRKESFGFTLGIGNWHIGANSTKELSRTIQENSDSWQRVAYHGVRTWTQDFVGPDVEWTVDFKADTNEYRKEPKIKDLYLGLHLLYRLKPVKKFKEIHARSVVDEAIIWRVLGEPGEADAVQKILDFAGSVDGKSVETRLELTIPSEVLRNLIPVIASESVLDFAPDLARAMNWTGWSTDRDDVDRRERLYTPVWRFALEHPGISPSDLAVTASQILKSQNADSKLVNIERAELIPMGTAAWYVRMHPKTPAAIGFFIEGMNKLKKGTELDWDHNHFKSAYKDTETVWRNYHPVRAAGAHLTRLAMGLPTGLTEINRTLTVAAAGSDKALVFSKSA